MSDDRSVPTKPRRAPWVRVVDRTGTSKLVDSRGDQLLQLNDTALAIWDLCDGETAVAEMAQAVVEAFPVDEETAVEDVQTVVEAFDRLHLLEHAE